MFTLRKLKYALAIIVGLYVLYILAVGLISSPSGELYKPQMLDQNATDQDRAMVLAEGVTHALG